MDDEMCPLDMFDQIIEHNRRLVEEASANLRLMEVLRAQLASAKLQGHSIEIARQSITEQYLKTFGAGE